MTGTGSLSVFTFDAEGAEVPVRIIDRAGDPWFVVVDVCRAIGVKNSTKAVERLDADEKSTLPLSKGGPKRLIVSESGMHTLVLRSDAAIEPGTAAHRFRKWVTAEVLPSIRRTGRYAAPEVAVDEVGMKLRLVNTAVRTYGQRAGAQLWQLLGLPMVPAMFAALGQLSLFDVDGANPARPAASSS